jgi:hypothetical protein
LARSQSIGGAVREASADGAFALGALDQLPDNLEAGRLEIVAASGTGVGSLNATALTLGFLDDRSREHEQLCPPVKPNPDSARWFNRAEMASGLAGNVDSEGLVRRSRRTIRIVSRLSNSIELSSSEKEAISGGDRRRSSPDGVSK